MNLTNDDAHWLAGLLEGEGSFLAGPPSEPNSPRIALEMTDLDVVERAARLMNVGFIHRGRRHPERGWKPSFRIALKHARGVRLMLALRPLMGELRRSQIDAALRRYSPGGARLSTSVACIVADCGGRVHGRDRCKRHYQSWITKRGGRAPAVTLADLDPHPTWQWTAEAQRLWLAGLLEGEGTLSPGTPTSPTIVRVSVKMCERDVVERARGVMRSSRLYVRHEGKEKRWRPTYETAFSGRRAEALMRELRPLMGSRRQAQIDRALACRARLRYVRLIPAPPHCINDGCNVKPRGRGLCHKHYMRWLRTSGSEAIRESRKSGANMK